MRVGKLEATSQRVRGSMFRRSLAGPPPPPRTPKWMSTGTSSLSATSQTG